MLAVVFQTITWGLLAIFVAFVVFGLSIAVFTLAKFYLNEFSRLAPKPTRHIGPAE